MDFLKKKTFIANLIRKFKDWGPIMTEVYTKQQEESANISNRLFTVYTYSQESDASLTG